MTVAGGLSIQQAIEQLVTTGETDPVVIAQKIRKRYDEKWLASELLAVADDVLAELARQRLGSVRRRAEIALRPGDPISQGELSVKKDWIPGVGWKRAADLTSDDLRARAKMFRMLAFASSRREQWCLEIADMIDAQGVKTLGKVKGDLPPLPDLDELEAA